MLTLRRYEYLCRIASDAEWQSVTSVMRSMKAERIAAHQAIRDLASAGYLHRRKRNGRIEVKVTVAGSLAIREFFKMVQYLFMLSEERKRRNVARARPDGRQPAGEVDRRPGR